MSVHFLSPVFRTNLMEMEKNCQQATQACKETRLQYEEERAFREELQEQLQSEKKAHDTTQAELGGISWRSELQQLLKV